MAIIKRPIILLLVMGLAFKASAQVEILNPPVINSPLHLQNLFNLDLINSGDQTTGSFLISISSTLTTKVLEFSSSPFTINPGLQKMEGRNLQVANINKLDPGLEITN